MKRTQLPEQVGGPVRTCLGCGKRLLKKELWRFVADQGGAVLLDSKRCLPGRGVYCCPEAGCLLSFMKKKGKISRGLRVTDIDCSSVFRLVEEGWSDIAGCSN
jgi:hypothetical protein